MQPTDREGKRRQFAEIVTEALSRYDREVSPEALEVWMRTLADYGNDRVQAALDEHAESAEDGKRAPRPVDIWRRLNSSGGKGRQCAASSSAGMCQYPGVFSDATDGSGQWWCPWHRLHRTGPEADRYIEASRSVPWEVASAKRIERMGHEARGNPHVTALRERIAARMGRKREDEAA